MEDQGKKLGTLNKEKSGYSFFSKGHKIELSNLKEFKDKFGTDIDLTASKGQSTPVDPKVIYDFPCSSIPYNPVFNVQKKLPIYAKSTKSKSLYCAGYYLIQFRKGWVKSFCPKLITLERYVFQGPFKTEADMKSALITLNKNETD